LIALNAACILFLLFGGYVFDSAIIFILPFLALNVGVLVAAASRYIGWNFKQPLLEYAFGALTMIVLLYPFWVFYSNRTDAYTVDQVSGQVKAVEQVRLLIGEDKVIVTDNYAFIELRQTHPNTHHYWKVDTDPAVQFNILDDDPCRVDYVITTPQVYADRDIYQLGLMRRVLDRWKFAR
jgi:hypothetical protein